MKKNQEEVTEIPASKALSAQITYETRSSIVIKVYKNICAKIQVCSK